MDDFEPRRPIAQQPQRARRVAAGQDETVAARAQPVDQVVQHAAETGKAFEGAQLEELVEQEGGVVGAAGAGPRHESQRLIERRTGCRRPGGIDDRERRGGGDGSQKPLRGGRRTLHVYVLRRRAADAVAQLLQDRRPSRPTAADEHGDAGRRRVERRGDTADERGAGGQHARSSRMGIRRPPRSAAASASG